MNKSLLPILVLFVCCLQVVGQEKQKVDYPETDIFLFELSMDGEIPRVSNGKNVTHRPGYDNQPFFTADSKTFLFSGQTDDYQTDVYEHVVESGEIRQITKSVNSEFSPQPSPDNRTISFVTDGEGANQSIWHVSRSDLKPVWTLGHLPEREPVGYYNWNHETGDLVYWSRYGFSMRLTHESKPRFRYITGNAIPTNPQTIPGTNKFSFVHRQGNEETWIKELDPETLAVRPIVQITGSNSHYGWSSNGTIFMIQDDELLHCRLEKDADWERVTTLAEFGIHGATRVAISPDGKMLAVVGTQVEE